MTHKQTRIYVFALLAAAIAVGVIVGYQNSGEVTLELILSALVSLGGALWIAFWAPLAIDDFIERYGLNQ